MAEFSGMNVEAILGQVVPGLRRQSDAVNQVIREVERIIQTAQNDWKGQDSKQFTQKWEGEYKRPLTQLVEELKQLADIAQRNAQKQQQTSAQL